jgi:glycosyltransferase involved in cell wall biosynthesis
MTLAKLKEFYRRKKYIKERVIHQTHTQGKLRLSIITGQLAAGGVERVLLSIIEGLPKNQFEITIYVTDFSNNTWLDKFAKYANIVHITKLLDWSTDERLISEYIAASIAANRDDIIFITNSSAGYRALKAIYYHFLLARHSYRSYDLLHTHGTPSDNDAFLRISQPYDKYLTRRIVISHYLKDYFCKHYPVNKDKVLVIHNGIPKGKTSIKADQKLGRELLHIGPSQRAISYIGRLQSDKSPDRLVELASMSKQILQKNNAFIAVVGEGNLRMDMERKSKELDILGSVIRFYGYTDTPASIMSASYFTILTSDLEGVPMSILESMDVGTPTIAPNVGGIPEIMADHTGILVDFTNSHNEEQKMLNLSHGLEAALNLDTDDLSKMKKRAQEHIDTQFKHMEEDYLNLFTYGRLD